MASGAAAKPRVPQTLGSALAALPQAPVVRCKVCGLPPALRSDVEASMQAGETLRRLSRALELMGHRMTPNSIGRHRLDHMAHAKTQPR